MRTTKELLILLRDKLHWYIKGCGGMCNTIACMYHDNVITSPENYLLRKYIGEKANNNEFWFPRGELEPRINWLNEQIEKLNKQQLLHK